MRTYGGWKEIRERQEDITEKRKALRNYTKFHTAYVVQCTERNLISQSTVPTCSKVVLV